MFNNRGPRQSESGQILLEYMLVLAFVALPLLLTADTVRKAMGKFLHTVVRTVAIWPSGS